MFEKASRLKLRFNYRGLASVEDLWDLPLTALDAIFKTLNAAMKAQKEESLLETKSQADEILDLQISIVKHIVEVRLAEQKARQDEAANAARKQKILGIIADKQDAALQSLPIEELTKLVNGL
jgi:hypothetical protein